MNMQFNSKTILTMLVVFLLGTNIASILTFRNHLKSEDIAIKPKIEIPDSQFGMFFNEALNLNTEQQDKFREFRRKYNRSANQKLFEMEQIREEMAIMLKTSIPDRKNLNLLAEQLGQKHRELKGLTFDYYFNMQSVLDKVQQEKMIDIFQAMLTETGDAKTPTPGGNGHQGHQRGGGMIAPADTINGRNQ